MRRQSNEDESWWYASWEARVCTDESSLNCHAPVKTRWELMRVKKREFAREFSQLSCAVKRGWEELMRVEKWEFAREFSQLSCAASQTRMRVDASWEARVCTRVLSTLMRRTNEDESRWELRSESLHESSLNSHARSNEDEKSWWELRSESLHESSLNSHAPDKRGVSWWELMSPSHSNKACKFFFNRTFLRPVNIKFCWLRLSSGQLCTILLSLLLQRANR